MLSKTEDEGAMSWIPALRPEPCREANVRLKRGESKGRPDQRPAEKRGPEEPDAAELYVSFSALLHLPGFRRDEKRPLTTTQPIIDHQGQSSY